MGDIEEISVIELSFHQKAGITSILLYNGYFLHFEWLICVNIDRIVAVFRENTFSKFNALTAGLHFPWTQYVNYTQNVE